MGKYCYYDEQEKVIFLDASNLTLTPALVSEINADLLELARSLQPYKPYVISCWHNTKMSATAKERHEKEMGEMLKYVKGFVRYDMTDFMTKIGIQSESVNYGKSSNIFNSREEALQAIRDEIV